MTLDSLPPGFGISFLLDGTAVLRAQMHQGLDEEADRISGCLYNFHRTLVRTVPQIHAVHLNYSIADLETAGSTGRAVRQYILYEYPGDILGLTGAAVVQIDLPANDAES